MQLPKWLLWLILILIPVAFLVNLGVQPFIDDEGNRSLVAMEMIWSGNFVTPTLHGAYYYNKPPLWNWILSASFSIFGTANEWATRLPSVLALFGFTVTIFAFYRRHFSFEKALFISLIFITSGRILFWESLLGLIDISFSWAMFTLFMVIFREGERQRWWRLFLFSYLLMVAGFMFKGLPAIVFQGFTLITYLTWRKDFMRLFSIPHIVSGLLAVGLLALYYGIYHQYNNLEEVFNALFIESGKRTAVSHSLWDTLKHVLLFPTELFYHFLPWTFLAILLIRKKHRQRVFEQPIIIYGLLVFGANVIVYWLSPNFYPRYILMLLPLGLAALVQLYPENRDKKDWTFKAIHWFLGILLCLTIAISIATVFVEETQAISGLLLKSGGATIVLSFLLYCYYKQPESGWFIVLAGLLVFRLGFDLFAVPPRADLAFSTGQRIKVSAQDFAKRWDGRELAIFHKTDMEPAVSFYIENDLQYIIPRHLETLKEGQFYIYNPDQYEANIFEPAVDSLKVRHTESPYYYVAKLKTANKRALQQATIREPRGF